MKPTWLLAATAVALLLDASVAAEEAERWLIGQPVAAEHLQKIDIDVLPDGRGLPEGQGSMAEGKAIYDKQCAACHGTDGVGGSYGSLAGGRPVDPAAMAADRSYQRTIGNYWPYATSLFDYIRRAMPYNKPGSLTNDELYAITGYLLFLNTLISENETMTASTLPAVAMPARDYFKAAVSTP